MSTVKTIGSDLYSTLRHADDLDYCCIMIKDYCADRDTEVHHYPHVEIFPTMGILITKYLNGGALCPNTLLYWKICLSVSELKLMVVVLGISRSMTTEPMRRYCATKIWDEDWHNLGEHYEKTLLAWHKKFEKTWLQLKNKYDEKFRHMFEYYLLCCAGSFRARYIQLWQIVFTKYGTDINHCVPIGIH